MYYVVCMTMLVCIIPAL